MEYNELVLKELYDYIETFTCNKAKQYSSSIAIKDKLEHIKNTVTFSKMMPDSSLLLEVATMFHDIGRFAQFELIGNFNDRVVSHLCLGENYILSELGSNKLRPSLELDMIRLVILYHGRQQFIPNKHLLTPDMISLVDDVSNIDNIENGCIGAIGYLEREVKEDAKGYRANNPNVDMKSVSDYVLTEFLAGNKFDKTVCKTYAEYILFAAVLAIQGLKSENQSLARQAMGIPCFGHANALEGYRYIFESQVDPSISKICIDALYNFYDSASKNEFYKPSTLLKKKN